MSANDPSDATLPGLVELPACPECGTQMRVTQIEPDRPGRDKRTFKCPLCSVQIVRICAI
jgi:hypothetical protein